jgi:photosystem II stability/assembly factor-like uncharacterized protein
MAVAFSVTLVALTAPTPPSLAATAPHRPAHARAGIAVDRLRQPQFVTATRGFALVDHGTGHRVGLATTLDGGRRWTSVRRPRLDAGASRSPSVDDFSLTLTRERVLVSGPAGLFTRRRSHGHWQHPIDTRVGEVAVVGSSVWASTWPCAPGEHCRGSLQVSRDFGRTWTRRALLPRGVGAPSGPPRLVRDSRRTAYLVRPDRGRAGMLAATADGGRSWTSTPLPPRTEHERSGSLPLAVGPDGSLWLAIPGEPSAGSEAKSVYRSYDQGSTWHRVAVSSPRSHSGHGALPTAGYVAGLRAVGSRTAYLVLSRALPLETTDGGHTWHDAFSQSTRTPGGDASTVWLDSLGGRHAWLWVGLAHNLWTTTDGGRSWDAVARYPIHRPLPRCGADQLRLWLRESGSNMSQPYARIGVRNVSPTACMVRGYPRISAFGAPVGDHGGAARALAIHVKRGSFMEARDRGPKRIGLRPNSRAVFSLGTATAYSPHLIEIRAVSVILPGIPGRFDVQLRIGATAPKGHRIPMYVTALDWRVR